MNSSHKTYVVPDLHGRADLLKQFLRSVDVFGNQLIFLGDYIDRGDGSASVIEIIRDLDTQGSHVFLKGNHEKLMVEAVLEDNGLSHEVWISNGGIETIESYERLYGENYHQKLKSDAEFLDQLPIAYEDDLRVFVHAFAPEEFDVRDFPSRIGLWRRYKSGQNIGYRGKHVVHGHVRRHEPERLSMRTNLDGGAYKHGKLFIGVFDNHTPQPIDILEVVEEAGGSE